LYCINNKNNNFIKGKTKNKKIKNKK